MNCYNQKCKKLIIKCLLCNKCQQKLCSNQCMIEHDFEYHQNLENEFGKTYSLFKNLQNKQKSLFIKKGEFLKTFHNDPLFDFNNFDFVKVGLKKQVLGTGAFGEVYLAKNLINGCYYAIKHMHKKKITDHGANLDIVQREINIHKRLIHDNIIRMYSSFEDKKSFYLIMDYATNHTVFSLIKKKNGMSESEAFKYFIDTVSAVHFLHENNLIHRDLKPENLLIDDNGSVKLCDFGWCVELAVGNRSTFCGTYEYMAPEIINEDPYDNGIDVWSLGVLLYELLHGYSPFRAKVMKSHEREYIEIFRNIVSLNYKIEKEISATCVDLINKLLTPNSKNRLKVNEIFCHPWVKSYEKEFRNHKMYQGSNIQGLNLDVSCGESNKNTNSKDKDTEKLYEINRFKNQLDNSKNIDLNRSFDSSCKINNDLRKLNNIINNNNKKINKETNITKNTIQNNQSMSQMDLTTKKDSPSNQSNKGNNSIDESKNDKIFINVSIIEKKASLDKTNHSESIIIENKEINNNGSKSHKLIEKSCDGHEKNENKDNVIVKLEDFKNDETVKVIEKEENKRKESQKLSKEKEEQLLLSKKKLQMSIDSSKIKLMEDFNLKLSSQDETLKMSVCRNSHGSLFDKVLNQVQLKNRTKKIHKNKDNEESFENRCIVQNTNKIFIVAEKPVYNNMLYETINIPVSQDEIKKSQIIQKTCPLIDKLMVDKQNGKSSTLLRSENNNNFNNNVDNKEMIVKPKEENEVFKNLNNNNIGMDPRVYNDLLIYEKENMIIRNKLDINNLSNIEVNHSDFPKISPSLGFIGEERPILFETPKMFKLQICKTDFQIPANDNHVRERLQYLENTLKKNNYHIEIEELNEDESQRKKMKKGKGKERENSSNIFKSNPIDEKDQKIILKSKSNLKNRVSNEMFEKMENKDNKYKKLKTNSELKSYQYKLSKQNSRKCWKVKLYENKDKGKENIGIERLCSYE